MDPYEAYRIVYARVQVLDPDNVTKILGYLLLLDHGEQEMFRLALGSDVLLHAMVVKAKKELCLTPRSSYQISHELSQLSNRSLLSSQLQQLQSQLSSHSPTQLSFTVSNSHVQPDQERLRPSSLYSPDDHSFFNFNISPLLEQQLPVHEKLTSAHERLPSYHDRLFLHDQLPIHGQLHHSDTVDGHGSLRIFPNENSYPESFAFFNSSKLHVEQSYSRSSSRRISPVVDSYSHPDVGSALGWKPCLYFARGYCKHGSNCRFLHAPGRENSGPCPPSNEPQEMRGEEGIASDSLERLEMELQELLRGRRAPVSIASLPQLYYERFGKTLQAEGYLTESQRHGKAGYSLTKLLARVKHTVTLIDRHKHTPAFLNRPHGQHAVVLAEDAHRFTTFRGERDDSSGINPSSRQIYLTFPAESSFTEEDVTSHFRAYGPVQDVRIPYQQKRMFGFVTFVYSETVKAILSEGNPHYICGARVLVKPYREKGKHGDRKYSERVDHLKYQQPRIQDLKDCEFNGPSTPKYIDDDESFMRRLEENDEALDQERRRLAGLGLADTQRRCAEAELNLIAAQQAQAQAQQNLSIGVHIFGEQQSLNVEDIPHFHPSSLFGYLVDVLDGENGDVVDSTNDAYAIKQPSNGNHNLPENPFTSPHDLNKQVITFSLPEAIKSLSLGSQSTSWTPYHHASAATLFASNVF